MAQLIDSLESFVQDGQKVLVLWKHNCGDGVEKFVNILKQILGSDGSVHLEHCDRLVQANYGTSTFDRSLIGFLSLDEHHEKSVLIETARLLKPDGKIYLFYNTKTVEDDSLWDEASLKTAFKLSGFTDIKLDSLTLCGLNKTAVPGMIVEARKPRFEVGSSRQLIFSNTDNTQQEGVSVRSIWSLDVDTEDVELVNDDDLLDDRDLDKSVGESQVKSCNPKEKKRKACINCTCGLADELQTEEVAKQKSVTSACGSCYLGDAFRCASCPYLGMPAFQPGENVKLSATQMRVDT